MKLSLAPNVTPFTLETSNGDIELVFSKFTVLDGERRQSLVNAVFDNPKATELDKYNAVNIARVICSVKYADTFQYFWDQGIEHFKSQNYEMDFINALIGEVDKLNPVFIPGLTENGKPEKALDAKKKRS